MSDSSLAARYASHFPVREHWLYVNHASVSPLCLPAAYAMKELVDEALAFGSVYYDRWLAAYGGLRHAAAQLINGRPEEIAIVKNTSEGIATVANGLKWKRGDKVIAFREEFPSNFFPWKRLESLGVEVHWLSVFASLEQIAEACHGARMLAISYVQYLSGHRVNLTAIGEICRSTGTFFFVDAIQGMGAFPIDVRRDNIQALAADGHKWMMGPEGCGVLFVQQDWQDRIEPMEFGWTNVAGFHDYSSRDMALRPDAGRYECGTLNTVGCYGLRASIKFILEIGVEQIAEAILALTGQLWEGILKLGVETCGPRTPENAAGIVTFRKPNVESAYLVRQLKDHGITAAHRQGWVRFSPHFYQSAAEIDRLLDALRACLV